MIKKLLTLSILTGILIMPLYPVYAVDFPSSRGNSLIREKSASETTKLKDVRAASAGALLDLRKQKIATMTAALKDRLGKFNDKARAQRVERISAELAKINERRTSAMTHNLDRFSEILTKLENRIADSTTSANNANVQDAISEAKNQLADSKEFVASQSAKDYIIQVSSESAVKKDSKVTRDQLFNDLKIAHDQVKSAKLTVVGAIKAVAQSLGGSK